MRYPEAVNLPFNNHSVRDGLRMIRPGEPVPSGEPFWLLLQGGGLLVTDAGGILRLPEGDVPVDKGLRSKALCIGIWHERPLLALRLPREVPLLQGWVNESFNSGLDRLDDATLTLGGLAQQILSWERQSARCSVCSSSTETIPGGWGKRCQGCGHEHFPHIHPCIIVLVRRGDHFLLVRKPEWPQGRFSLVAGFVDFGESLEECVRREVREETGVEVENIRYVGSQNWPFPSQLMTGFVADYAGGELRVDGEELEDGRWFHAGELPQSLPGRRSIARWIIDRFALGEE
jgi:NAD+ diphosphatase